MTGALQKGGKRPHGYCNELLWLPDFQEFTNLRDVPLQTETLSAFSSLTTMQFKVLSATDEKG